MLINVPAKPRGRRHAPALASRIDRPTPWRCVASSSPGVVARLPRTRRAPRARRGRRRGLHKQTRVPTRTRKTRTKTKTIKRVGCGCRARRVRRSSPGTKLASFHAFPRAWFARTFGPARPSSPVAPRTRSRPRARNVLAEDGSVLRGGGPVRRDPARTACFVAVAEPGRGGVFSAARGPASPYARPYRRTGRTRGTSSSGSRGRVPARAGASTRNAPTCSPRTRRRARRARIPGEDTFSVSLCMYR